MSSSSVEVAPGSRSRPLGVKTTSGRGLRDPRLAAQQVEVLGRGGRVGEPDVALGGELDEALDPGARVLGAAPRSRAGGAA